MVKIKDIQFLKENQNEQKKSIKDLTDRSGDQTHRFSVIFPYIIWIFMQGEGDEIKLKQASKRDRTLPLA